MKPCAVFILVLLVSQHFVDTTNKTKTENLSKTSISIFNKTSKVNNKVYDVNTNTIIDSSFESSSKNNSETQYSNVLNHINKHKFYLLEEFKKIKSQYPSDYHDDFINVIKEIQVKAILDEEAFKDYVLDKYEYLKYMMNTSDANEIKDNNENYNNNNAKDYEDNDIKNLDKFNLINLLQDGSFSNTVKEIIDLLFRSNTRFSNVEDKKASLKAIIDNSLFNILKNKNKEDRKFYHSVLKQLINNSILEYQTKRRIKDLSLKHLIEYLVYYMSEGKKLNRNDKDNIGKNNEFYYNRNKIPNSFRINKQFNNFLIEIETKYNLKDLYLKYSNNKMHESNKKAIMSELLEIINRLEAKDKSQFNILFQEYLTHSVINNEEFKENYTKNKLKDKDISLLLKKQKSSYYDKEKPGDSNMRKIKKPKIEKEVVSSNNNINNSNKSLNYSSFLLLKEAIFNYNNNKNEFVNDNTPSETLEIKKQYKDYIINTTQPGLLFRINNNDNKINKTNQEITQSPKIIIKSNIVNSDKEVLQSLSPITTPISHLSQKKLSSLEREEARLKKLLEKDLLQETKITAKEIHNNVKAKYLKAEEELKLQKEAIQEMKEAQIEIEKIKKSAKYKAKTTEKKGVMDKLESKLLKPVMDPIEEASKEASKLLKNSNKKEIKTSIKKAIKANLVKRAKKDSNNIIDLSGNCKDQEDKLKDNIERQMKNLNDENKEADEALSEVKKSLFNNLGDPKKVSSTLTDILSMFLKKLSEMVVKHIPFYFFKICVPPGPLTFGCCPEAAFFPQQLYAAFSAFEKVEKFKISAKGYPTWLRKNNNQDFDEIDYYVCAQSYLTLTESTLFNFCNSLSLVVIHPLNLAGMLPGDLPLCFWACLSTAITCRVWINKIPECDALINIEVVIKAMLSIPDRFKLTYIFSQCTYIPFLIRWDLVPPWKPKQPEPGFEYNAKSLNREGPVSPAQQQNKDDKNAKPELNCANEELNPNIKLNSGSNNKNRNYNNVKNKSNNDLKDKRLSPFAQALLQISSESEANSIINKVKLEVQNKEIVDETYKSKEQEYALQKIVSKFRGKVKRTKIEEQYVNAASEDWAPNYNRDLDALYKPRKENEINDGVIDLEKEMNDDTIIDKNFDIYKPKITDIIENKNGREYIVQHIEIFTPYQEEAHKEVEFPFHALRIVVNMSGYGKNVRSVTGLNEGFDFL